MVPRKLLINCIACFGCQSAARILMSNVRSLCRLLCASLLQVRVRETSNLAQTPAPKQLKTSQPCQISAKHPKISVFILSILKCGSLAICPPKSSNCLQVLGNHLLHNLLTKSNRCFLSNNPLQLLNHQQWANNSVTGVFTCCMLCVCALLSASCGLFLCAFFFKSKSFFVGGSPKDA